MPDLRLVNGSGGRPRATEFFGGIGLARLGLEAAGFDVVWTNDFSRDKRRMYEGNFESTSDHQFVLGDVGDVRSEDLPSGTALSWASSPCTDVSLAGDREGLNGSESGTFWHWTRILDELEDRRPPVVTLENVTGLATSHGGDDIAAAVSELNQLGYSVDVLALDARRFVPQSRPRLFIVGAQNPPPDDPSTGSELRPDELHVVFGDPSLRTHRAVLPAPPPPLTAGLTASVERFPPHAEQWWDESATTRFIGSLSLIQANRLAVLRKSRTLVFRTAYRRTRKGVAVWEIRPDDVSGCLRTARGGSSKQAVVQAGRGVVKVRWMTAREYARLMGAPDYQLAGIRRNQALWGFGDAVCVPAVTWLAEHYLMPLVRGELQARADPLAVAHGE